MSVPRLRMLAGPNGSGKSTLFDFLATLSFRLGHGLNRRPCCGNRTCPVFFSRPEQYP
jgi:hypothetical protein